jgi:hypothetical protein
VSVAAKLGDFLDWASAMGLTPVRAADYRRIAVELFELAGGGRVTESHILRLIDGYADRPGGRAATPLIEEVGEALLRYEAARRTSAVTPPVSGSPTPVPPRRTPSEPFTARPEERVAVELRPPAEPRETPPPQKVVSFAAGAEPPARGAPAPRRRASGTQFRCLRCKTMVTPDERGACPRCGQIAPRVSSNQLAAVAPPATTSTGWLLPVVLGVVAFALAFQFGPPLFERLTNPSKPAAGVHSSPHLGVRVAFPDGWRHASDGDRAPATAAAGFEAVLRDGVGLRTARYFRTPRTELLLTVAPRPSQVTDEAFTEWASAAVAEPRALERTVREVSGVSALAIDRCVAGPPVPGGGLRCIGTAGDRRVLVYVWPARTVSAVGVFVTDQNAQAALAEADAVVEGLDLG